jgi:alkylated DNA nucleotide flippase Atl1
MSRARRRRKRVLGHLTELRGLPLGGGPGRAFRERLRDDLVSGRLLLAEKEAPPLVVEETGRPAHRRPVRRRSLVSQLATFGLAAAMMVSAFVTYQAVPGDTLYPLKRAAESTLVHLSTDDAERGERELASAETRAKEIAGLLGSSNDGRLVSKTLKDMEDSTHAGIDRLKRTEPRATKKIKKFAQNQRDMVEPMLDHLNEAQKGQAAGYLDYIEGLVAPS